MNIDWGEFCWVKRPYSDWHGCRFTVEYWPGYGIVAPTAVTTNGNPDAIRQLLNDKDAEAFKEFVLLTRKNT
jgi:hypothetical protein